MPPLPPPNQPTVDAIYQWHERRQRSGGRGHLGASQIGAPCERALWYGFRWALKVKHAGRLLRLFETGQLAEQRFVAELRAVGVEVHEINPDTGAQFSVSSCRGHFGGSMDGVALGLLEAPKTWHVLEFKTHSAKSFAALKKDGVEKSKPEHAAQMQVYMHLAGLERAFYLAVDKNTDELYSERLHHDEAAALRLLAKASRIIDAAEPPGRISEDPAFYLCRWCAYQDICHGTEFAARTCRTCLHSTPVDQGQWDCARWGKVLTDQEQRDGCGAQKFIPALVPGEQVDVRDDAVIYRMPDGSEWSDSECPF